MYILGSNNIKVEKEWQSGAICGTLVSCKTRRTWNYV